MDRKKVEIETKEILEKYAKALEKIDEERVNFYTYRDKFEREEKEGDEFNFKKDLLENAPRKDKDFIIAEKGGWKWIIEMN